MSMDIGVQVRQKRREPRCNEKGRGNEDLERPMKVIQSRLAELVRVVIVFGGMEGARRETANLAVLCIG